VVIALFFGFVVYDSTRSILAGLIVGILGIAVIAALYLSNPLFFDGAMARTLRWFSLMARFNFFSRGILNISDVVYYITFSTVFIYLTINVIEKRRWK